MCAHAHTPDLLHLRQRKNEIGSIPSSLDVLKLSHTHTRLVYEFELISLLSSSDFFLFFSFQIAKPRKERVKKASLVLTTLI